MRKKKAKNNDNQEVDVRNVDQVAEGRRETRSRARQASKALAKETPATQAETELNSKQQKKSQPDIVVEGDTEDEPITVKERPVPARKPVPKSGGKRREKEKNKAENQDTLLEPVDSASAEAAHEGSAKKPTGQGQDPESTSHAAPSQSVTVPPQQDAASDSDGRNPIDDTRNLSPFERWRISQRKARRLHRNAEDAFVQYIRDEMTSLRGQVNNHVVPEVQGLKQSLASILKQQTDNHNEISTAIRSLRTHLDYQPGNLQPRVGGGGPDGLGSNDKDDGDDGGADDRPDGGGGAAGAGESAPTDAFKSGGGAPGSAVAGPSDGRSYRTEAICWHCRLNLPTPNRYRTCEFCGASKIHLLDQCPSRWDCLAQHQKERCPGRKRDCAKPGADVDEILRQDEDDNPETLEAQDKATARAIQEEEDRQAALSLHQSLNDHSSSDDDEAIATAGPSENPVEFRLDKNQQQSYKCGHCRRPIDRSQTSAIHSTCHLRVHIPDTNGEGTDCQTGPCPVHLSGDRKSSGVGDQDGRNPEKAAFTSSPLIKGKFTSSKTYNLPGSFETSNSEQQEDVCAICGNFGDKGSLRICEVCNELAHDSQNLSCYRTHCELKHRDKCAVCGNSYPPTTRKCPIASCGKPLHWRHLVKHTTEKHPTHCDNCHNPGAETRCEIRTCSKPLHHLCVKPHVNFEHKKAVARIVHRAEPKSDDEDEGQGETDTTKTRVTAAKASNNNKKSGASSGQQPSATKTSPAKKRPHCVAERNASYSSMDLDAEIFHRDDSCGKKRKASDDGHSLNKRPKLPCQRARAFSSPRRDSGIVFSFPEFGSSLQKGTQLLRAESMVLDSEELSPRC